MILNLVCPCVSGCGCVRECMEARKSVSGLKLQVVVRCPVWMPEAKPGFSERAACTLSQQVVFGSTLSFEDCLKPLVLPWLDASGWVIYSPLLGARSPQAPAADEESLISLGHGGRQKEMILWALLETPFMKPSFLSPEEPQGPFKTPTSEQCQFSSTLILETHIQTTHQASFTRSW